MRESATKEILDICQTIVETGDLVITDHIGCDVIWRSDRSADNFSMMRAHLNYPVKVENDDKRIVVVTAAVYYKDTSFEASLNVSQKDKGKDIIPSGDPFAEIILEGLRKNFNANPRRKFNYSKI